MEIYLKQKTAPSTEPVSLADFKEFARIDSGTFADNVFLTQTIAPGSHTMAASYGLTGSAVEVLGYTAVVQFESGTNGTGGTVDLKLQDSDNGSTWVDVAGGSFTQVTTANDNATYEKAYIGLKRYIRAVATVAVAACEFGVSVIKYAATSAEDTTLTLLLTGARKKIESLTWRALVTQTWYAYPDSFPVADRFEMPLGNLQRVNSFTLKDSAGSTATLTENTDFLTDTSNDPGLVVLPYGGLWPSDTLWPVNPITIDYDCGYGATAASVPENLRLAIMVLANHYYENREMVVIGQSIQEIPLAVERLISGYRLNTI